MSRLAALNVPNQHSLRQEQCRCQPKPEQASLERIEAAVFSSILSGTGLRVELCICRTMLAALDS